MNKMKIWVVLLLGLMFTAPVLAAGKYAVEPSDKTVVLRQGMSMDFVIKRLYGGFPDLWPAIESKLTEINPKAVKSGELIAGEKFTLVRIIANQKSTEKQKPYFQRSGYVEFMSGNANAVNSTGEVRDLIPGDQLFEGDSIITAPDCEMIMVMDDGARITLKPDSEFRIDRYRISEDKQFGSAFMRLVRGGLRTVTGALGKQRTEYQLTTNVATIGIRGTDYAVALCEEAACVGADGQTVKDGFYAGVEEGSIDVKNDAGQVQMFRGDYAYVSSSTVAPTLIGAMGLLGLEAGVVAPEAAVEPLAETAEEPVTVEEQAEQEPAEESEEDEESSLGWWIVFGLILIGAGA